jgi:hypothetical protein
MSIKDLAAQVQAQGRGKDSVLIHMSPNEVQGLRELAQASGGDLTINPETGLPEAGWLESILPIVAGAAAMFIPGLQGVGATMIAGAMAGGTTALALGGGPDEVATGMLGGVSGANMGTGLGLGSAGGAGGAGTAAMGAEAATATMGAEAAAVDPSIWASMGEGTAGMDMATGWGGMAADGVYSVGADGLFGAAAQEVPLVDALGDGMYVDAAGADMGLVDALGDGMYGESVSADQALMESLYGFEGGEPVGDVMRTPGASDPFNDTLGAAAAPGKGMTQAQMKQYMQKMYKAAQLAQKAGLLGPNGQPKQQQRQPMGAPPAYNPPDMLNAPVASGGGFQPTWRQGANPASIPGTLRRAEGGLLPEQGMASGGFVVPADAVSALGNGSTDAGLRALEAIGAKPIRGPGDGLSDDIDTHIEGRQPARVADGEAYIQPEMVERLGGGDHSRGAQRLYKMMDQIRKQAHGKTEQQRPVDPQQVLA